MSGKKIDREYLNYVGDDIKIVHSKSLSLIESCHFDPTLCRLANVSFELSSQLYERWEELEVALYLLTDENNSQEELDNSKEEK